MKMGNNVIAFAVFINKMNNASGNNCENNTTLRKTHNLLQSANNDSIRMDCSFLFIFVNQNLILKSIVAYK